MTRTYIKKSTKQVAKRKLSDIDFSKEGAHLALVSQEQGGPANGHDYSLVMKSVNFSKEAIEKMQQVRVTMELPDFLQKFFYIYGEDAKVLAYMMGYVEPEDTQAMENAEAEQEYQDWIKERASSFEILKSLNESTSLVEALSKLDENQYLAVLEDQQTIEKALVKIEKNSLKKEEGTSAKQTEVSKKAVPSKKIKGKQMDDEIVVETVEKAKFDDIQKAFNEQKEQLEKALADLAAYEAEKKEALLKQRKQKVVDAVKDEGKAEILFKAVSLLQDETEFEAVVKTLAEMQSVVEKSELFKEVGTTVDDIEPEVQESAVAKVLKARLNKK